MKLGDKMQDDMFNIGKIVNTHGIKGEVKVVRITDFGERFTPGETLFAVTNSALEELEIDAHRVHKGFDLVQFKGYESINDVERFKNVLLQIHISQLTDLEEDAYYYYEIIGCTVYTDTKEKIGVVKEILAPGANDVWVVEASEGKDILIPYIADVVQTVNTEKKEIIITPMEGLFD